MGTETHLLLYVMFSCSHCGTVEGLKWSCPICGGNVLTFEGTEERCQKICRHKNLHMCWQTGNLLLSNYVVPVVRN